MKTNLGRVEDPQSWNSDALEQTAPMSQASLSLSQHLASSGNSTPSDLSSKPLPAFVKPLPPKMGTEDIEYLRVKGALTLPEPDLLDACLQSYFQNVQPLFPIVDAFKIITIVKGVNTDEKLSLLLLQAMIFVGSTWVDVKSVRKLGFLSRKGFRRSINGKMRLLYDSDYEDDRLCLIQTFVLWTFWFEGPNQNKDAWHWIGVALSLSRTISLHQSPSNFDLNPSLRKLRRRLWWGLVTRDTIASFGLSRSPRISDINHNVPMLEVEDFDSGQALEFLDGAVPPSLRQQQMQARLCVSFVQLVHIFGRIFKAAYPEIESGKTAVLYSRHQLEGMDKVTSKKKPLDAQQLKSFERDLSQWRQDISDELWHSAPLSSTSGSLEIAEQAHKGLMSMMYYAALMNLHRPQMMPPTTILHPTEPSATTTQDNSRAIVRFAAQQITKIAMDFYEEDLVGSLSATCISCLVPASIYHIFDMTSADSNLRIEALQRLEQCKAIFQAFSDQQFGGPWALHTLNYIINRLEERKLQLAGAQASVNIASTASTQDPQQRHPTSLPIENGVIGAISAVKMQSLSRLGQPSDGDLTSNKRSAERKKQGELTLSSPMVGVFPTLTSIGTVDTLLPPFTTEQPMLDDLTTFLGPDLSWFDFAHASNNLEAMDSTNFDPT